MELPTTKTITETAVFLAGGPTKLAQACDCSRQLVHGWIVADRVSLTYLETVARESGIAAALLRPDIARIFDDAPPPQRRANDGCDVA